MDLYQLVKPLIYKLQPEQDSPGKTDSGMFLIAFWSSR